MTDRDWMRWNHKPPAASPSPREEVFGFALVKDVRTMTGLLRRVDDARWEAVYLIDGAAPIWASEISAQDEFALRRRSAIASL